MKTRNCIFLLIVCFLIACSSVAAPTATPTQPKPTSTVIPTSTNTPAPTQPPDQFIIDANGRLNEFVNGAYVPVENLGPDVQYKIGADGKPVAFYPVDNSLFHNSDGLQIAVRENGQWVMNDSITLTRTQQGLQQIVEFTDNDAEQSWIISENNVRHDIIVARMGDIVGLRVVGDMSKNQASVQFLMLFNEGRGNELLLVQPPEISHQEFIENQGSVSIEPEGKGTHVFINGNLSLDQVIEIVNAYQGSLKDQFSSHIISSFAFTQGVARWIDDQAASFGVSKDIVCRWLGIPFKYDSPTVVEMCMKMYNDPAFRLTADQVHQIMLDHIQSGQQITADSLWNANLPVLKASDQFWFFTEIRTAKK